MFLAQVGPFGRRFNQQGGDWHWAGAVFMLLIFAALVTVVVLLLLRNGRHGHLHQHYPWPLPPPGPGRGPAPADEALTHLRLRYARGELSRDEYLRMSADLGAPVVDAPAPPPAPPPA